MSESMTGQTSATEAASTPDLLHQTVVRLAEVRRVASHLAEQVKERNEAFKVANADLLTSLHDAEQTASQLEDELRLSAVARFRVTQNKDVAPGVTIRLTRAVQYDKGVLATYAKEHGLPMVPDYKAIEKIALASPEMVPVATIVEEPKASVALDLDKALAAVTK